MPAFSLVRAPPVLPLKLHRCAQRSPTDFIFLPMDLTSSRVCSYAAQRRLSSLPKGKVGFVFYGLLAFGSKPHAILLLRLSARSPAVFFLFAFRLEAPHLFGFFAFRLEAPFSKAHQWEEDKIPKLRERTLAPLHYPRKITFGQ